MWPNETIIPSPTCPLESLWATMNCTNAQITQTLYLRYAQYIDNVSKTKNVQASQILFQNLPPLSPEPN